MLIHYDVIKWKHFPCYWPFVRGIHRSPVLPHTCPWVPGLQGVRKICISNAGTHGHTHQFSQSDQSRSHAWPITRCAIARTWGSAPKHCQSWRSSRTDHRFRDSFERIKWLYLHSKYGIKTKTHFEWLLWHWSSLGQLNLEREDQCQRSHAHGFLL